MEKAADYAARVNKKIKITAVIKNKMTMLVPQIVFC